MVARSGDWVEWHGSKCRVLNARWGLFMRHLDLGWIDGTVIPFVPEYDVKKLAAEPRSLWNWTRFYLRGMRE